MGKYSVGIDCHGEVVRVLVVDIITGSIRVQIVRPHIEPAKLVGEVVSAVQGALQRAEIEPAQIIGIGVASDDPAAWTGACIDVFGLSTHTRSVSSTPRAHAMVPGAGVAAPSTLVMLPGERHRYLLNSRVERRVAGVNGPVADGILPSYFAYEFEQTPADDALTTAMEFRRIVERLRESGVPVRRFVMCFETSIPPEVLQIYADMLAEKIALIESEHVPALGAAILACLAAGPRVTGYASVSQTVHAMSRQRERVVYRPELANRKSYAERYARYRALSS